MQSSACVSPTFTAPAPIVLVVIEDLGVCPRLQVPDAHAQPPAEDVEVNTVSPKR
jgi:hypothetical protein